MSAVTRRPARAVRRTGSSILAAAPLLAAALVAALLPPAQAPAEAATCPAPASAYAGGDGTSGDPYQIATTAELLRFATTSGDWVAGKHFLQTADISLTGCDWPDISFAGSYDGGGKNITGLSISGDSRKLGFFGEAVGASLTDIHLVDVSISGADTADGFNFARQVGGLVATSEQSEISRVTVSGSITTTTTVGYCVGGLVGYAWATSITESSSSATVTGTEGHSIGGLVGCLDEANNGGSTTSIAHSFATGSVTATGKPGGSDARVGGLVGVTFDNGYGNPVTITASYATGAVTGAAGNTVGGLVGENQNAQMIVDSYARGGVSGGTSGALVGKNSGTITDSASAGTPRIGDGSGTDTRPLALKNASDADGLATYQSAGWKVVDGWAPFVAGTAEWGICSGVNDGFPFLLWQFAVAPCVAEVVTDGLGSPLSLSCEGPIATGAQVTCAVSGGDPGIDILWRAAYNPVFATAGVTLDAAGTGTFSFTVPAAALGQELTVELVDWLAPASLGVAGGPVPASVPAGEGPIAPAWLLAFGLLAAAGAVVAVRRQVVAG
jgi:hypothetical protein